MSASYEVNGYVIVKIPIDDVYDCSQSSTPAEISEIVKFNLSCKIGSCEIIDHGLKLKRIG